VVFFDARSKKWGTLMAGLPSILDGANSGFQNSEVAVPLLIPQESGSDCRPRVLILEDDLLQLSLLEDHLKSLGMICTSVNSIQAARTELEHKKFELAILDVQLPDGSGLDLCDSIADDSRYSSLPMIVLSSLNQANMVRRTRAAGGSYFISKPYDPNVLLTVIERILGASFE
jgi:DNA-binding response OmpR family regulator